MLINVTILQTFCKLLSSQHPQMILIYQFIKIGKLVKKEKKTTFTDYSHFINVSSYCDPLEC